MTAYPIRAHTSLVLGIDQLDELAPIISGSDGSMPVVNIGDIRLQGYQCTAAEFGDALIRLGGRFLALSDRHSRIPTAAELLDRLADANRVRVSHDSSEDWATTPDAGRAS